MPHRFRLAPTLAAASILCTAGLFAQGAAPTTEVVHVVVTGGAKAGTYDAVAIKGGCSTGANGPGSWGNAYSVPTAAPAALGSLSLIVPDAKAAANGTKQFLALFGFGSLLNGTRTDLEIETRPSEKKQTGSGTVTVKDAGATAAVTIDGQTADGAKIHATIDCKSVFHL
jgi:hypothetical protein